MQPPQDWTILVTLVTASMGLNCIRMYYASSLCAKAIVTVILFLDTNYFTRDFGQFHTNCNMQALICHFVLHDEANVFLFKFYSSCYI